MTRTALVAAAMLAAALASGCVPDADGPVDVKLAEADTPTAQPAAPEQPADVAVKTSGDPARPFAVPRWQVPDETVYAVEYTRRDQDSRHAGSAELTLRSPSPAPGGTSLVVTATLDSDPWVRGTALLQPSGRPERLPDTDRDQLLYRSLTAALLPWPDGTLGVNAVWETTSVDGQPRQITLSRVPDDTRDTWQLLSRTQTDTLHLTVRTTGTAAGRLPDHATIEASGVEGGELVELEIAVARTSR